MACARRCSWVFAARLGFRLGLGLGLGLGLVACSSPSDDAGEDEGADDGDDGDESETGDGGPWSSLDERPCPEDSSLTYANFGRPYMLDHCTGCHASALPEGERQGAPLAVDFDSLEDVRAQAERIWARAGDQNASMPPVGPPGDDERALLGEWLACGAP